MKSGNATKTTKSSFEKFRRQLQFKEAYVKYY